MIDAAGAIYVIGGHLWNCSFTYFQDVWVSTDGGVDRTQSGGGGRRRYYMGTCGVL